jgi:hypothetical protein
VPRAVPDTAACLIKLKEKYHAPRTRSTQTQSHNIAPLGDVA